MEQKRGSYGFRFQENPYPFVMNLWNVGWEIESDVSYHWDGRKRLENEKIVFQYTLSGLGKLTYENKEYDIGKHQAFFVSVPSDHRYYFPPDSNENWEFIYVTMEGSEAIRMHEHILKKYGPVLSIQREAEPIRLLLKLLSETAAGDIHNSYIGSQKAYEFMTSMLHFLEAPSKKRLKAPIANAVQYIEEKAADPIHLEDIAHHVGLSKYYFIKQFKIELNITPMHYVTIVRMKKAAYLLAQTDDTIAEVAHQVGIDDPNYFTKLFKKTVGVSASKFRKNEDTHLIDYIITEW
ncbi:two-component response regulator [Bacillus sp. JCM 19046]|nr:two-component response regulator [Bacillus sp. JCM 19045]GAF16157.1 two-component response regulator [Bacillus sp. JCM 19046]